MGELTEGSGVHVWRVLVIGMLIVCGTAAAGAQGQPPPGPAVPNPAVPPALSVPSGTDVPDLQRWLNAVVPAPPAVPPATPMATGTEDDRGAVTADPDAARLRQAVSPKDVGDPLFDARPADLDSAAPGELLAVRDVTPVAAGIIGVAVRQVLQLKFRTTDAGGGPSYATASLVVPPTARPDRTGLPVLVNNLAIDALGRACTPSYVLAHGLSPDTGTVDYIPPTTQLAVLRGYAVLIPDHEGPQMAYAEPYVAGHAVLDAVRAVRNLPSGEFAASRYVMHGYSGGAIATRGAVVLIDSYAPELEGVIVGAALGGVPVDYRMLGRSMNGNLASGIFLAATFGIARERPEMLARMNNLARWAATSPLKDTCGGTFTLPGVLMLPIDLAAQIPDPLHSDVAAEIYDVMRMSGRKSAVPLYIYNGEQEWWIPAEGARAFYREQCDLGVPAVYRSVPGEHFLAADVGFPEAMLWVDARLQAAAPPDEC